MIDPDAVRAKAVAYQAEDPDVGSITALKLATVEALVSDPDMDPAVAMGHVRAVFASRGWEVHHVLRRLTA
jgi:hypothetical protein